MRPAEKGFLLLTSCLGDPERRPMSGPQLRTLAERLHNNRRPEPDRELQEADLAAMGYSREFARRILLLLSQEDLLEHYIRKGARAGCIPLTRLDPQYPMILKRRLAWEAPGCLWAKGNFSLLEKPMVALVGSREISPGNRKFAREVGIQAAKRGYVLVSGNARGADRIAQMSCLEHGGQIICVVADALADKKPQEDVLLLSEEDYDQGFSSLRALRRNRVIHALGKLTFVAQSDLGTGGTWNGTVQNLQKLWSPVVCFRDGSSASLELEQMGARLADLRQITDWDVLDDTAISLFDQ